MADLPTVDLDATGELSHHSAASLRSQMLAAAAAEDFATATQLKAMLEVLGPGPAGGQLTLADVTADDVNTAAEIFLELGFVVLPGCVAGPELAEMQAAYEMVAATSRMEVEEQWAAGTERVDVGKTFEFPMFEPDTGQLEFYPLLDPPKLMATLHRVRPAPPCAAVCRPPAGLQSRWRADTE